MGIITNAIAALILSLVFVGCPNITTEEINVEPTEVLEIESVEEFETEEFEVEEFESESTPELLTASTMDEIEAWFTGVACEDFNLIPTELRFYDTDELDYDTLTTRRERGEIIVERLVGIVVDEELNGEVINTDTEFNYITYAGLDFDLEPGDYVVTYLLYNTENDYEDDCYRYDYPIDAWN